jgi:hypothetical protein
MRLWKIKGSKDNILIFSSLPKENPVYDSIFDMPDIDPLFPHSVLAQGLFL